MGNSCNPKKKKKKRSRKKVATRRRSRKRKNNRKIANALPAKQSQVASLVSQPVCQTSKVTPIKILKKGQPRNQTTATPKGSTVSIALPTSSLASSQNSSAVPNLDLRTGSGPKNPTKASIASLVRCNAAKRDKVMQLQLNQLLQSIYHRVQATQKQTGGKVVTIKEKPNEDLLSSDKLRAHGLTSRQILKSDKLSFDHRLAQNIKEHAPLSLNVNPAEPSSAKKPAQRLKEKVNR